MSWTTIVIIFAGLLTAELRVVVADDTDVVAGGGAAAGLCDGGRAECATVAPRVGPPPLIAGPGASNAAELPAPGGGANASSEGGDRLDLDGAGAGSVVRAETLGSAVQGAALPENPNGAQVEPLKQATEASPTESVPSYGWKKSGFVHSAKEEIKSDSKQKESALAQDDMEAQTASSTFQVPEGEAVKKDVSRPPGLQSNENSPTSRYMKPESEDENASLGSILGPDKGSPTTVQPSVDQKSEATQSGSRNIVTQPPMATHAFSDQKVPMSDDTFPPAARVNEGSPMSASLQAQDAGGTDIRVKQHDNPGETDTVAASTTRKPVMKIVSEGVIHPSAIPSGRSVSLPSNLIRSQVAEPVLQDTILGQASEPQSAHQTHLEPPSSNHKAEFGEPAADSNVLHRPHPVDTVHQELEDTAPGFLPSAGRVKVTTAGRSGSPSVTADVTYPPTAIGSEVVSNAKISRLVDPVRQELEDPTPGPSQVAGELGSKVTVRNSNTAAAASPVESRTLLRSQLVDPVHQELEDTTPGAMVKSATNGPQTTEATAHDGASKVAFEFTNHVSVIYNETGAGPPADSIRRDLLVVNGTRSSYATAFLHSVQLGNDDDDDYESHSTTARGVRQSEMESSFEDLAIQQEKQIPHDAEDVVRPEPLPLSAINSNDNATRHEDVAASLQQQLHALKSDGFSTQPPVNTVKPSLDKDMAALKDLRSGAIQHRTTVEPVPLNRYSVQSKTDSDQDKAYGQQEHAIGDLTERKMNNTSMESKYLEGSAEGGVLIENSDIKQVKVATSAIPPTTAKDKTLGKDEDFKSKTKATVDSLNRNKKLITASTANHSNSWTRILPITSIKPQTFNKSESEDSFISSQEKEKYVVAEEKMLDSTNDSQAESARIESLSDSSGTIHEEMKMIPVPISTVIPSTMINHRHERVDNLKAETIVHAVDEPEEESNTSGSTNASPVPAVLLQANSGGCEHNNTCNGTSEIHNNGHTELSPTTIVFETSTTAVTSINTGSPIAIRGEITTPSGDENWTVSTMPAEKSTVPETTEVTSTDPYMDTTMYTTIQPETTSGLISSVPSVIKTVDNSTEKPQDTPLTTEFYSMTTRQTDSGKDEAVTFSTTEKLEDVVTTVTTPILVPTERETTTNKEGSQWLYGDQPQEGSNNNRWQEEATTTTEDGAMDTATYVPETTTEQDSDKDLNEWDVPDKSETVTAFCRLSLLASGEQVCLYLGGLPCNIAQILQQYTGRVIMYQQVVIHMPGKEVRCDDITRERTLDVYIQDENGSFDYDLSVLLKKIWDESHPSLPFQILNMELVKDGLNDTSTAPPDPGFESDPNGEITPGLLAAIIVACIGTVSLLLLFGLMVYVRRRQKRFNYGQRCTPVSLDAYSVDSISVYDSVRSRRKGLFRSSKRSYGNLAFDDPNSPSHPMNFAGLANFSSDTSGLQEEFEAVPQVTVTTDELPDGADVKNRYSNVIPLPETRVHLTAKEGEPLSDYINANYVRGPNNEEKFYIACQAPLQSTITDFWRMVWEQQTKVILMICNLVESGSEKCADYLPPSEVLDCHRLFGDFQITLKKREEKEKYVISTLQIKNLESNLWREVTHMWFASWPEQGVPDDPSPLIAFLIEARSHMRNAPGPHVVHCSPGTGRTGTVIACDILIREFERTRNVDVPRCVYRLRRDRAGAVKTKEQYIFIYKVLNHYAAMLTGGVLDSI
ncbi:uncharacterized protein LOC126282099 [Schistocerca gregaria]|uniref:uncharacterized protein LOC126282099 n=1 Tax=Schistocerca gregaria TaxID=7010 RepID=UPI00211F1A93|nr:uncharacterized protein LOC126282099 [Schistocerca gregaria]